MAIFFLCLHIIRLRIGHYTPQHTHTFQEKGHQFGDYRWPALNLPVGFVWKYKIIFVNTHSVNPECVRKVSIKTQLHVGEIVIVAYSFKFILILKSLPSGFCLSDTYRTVS